MHLNKLNLVATMLLLHLLYYKRCFQRKEEEFGWESECLTKIK